jgi:hypothetical protein
MPPVAESESAGGEGADSYGRHMIDEKLTGPIALRGT